MVSQDSDITDPSREIAELGQRLRSSPTQENVRVVEGLAGSIGVSADDPDLLEILAVIGRRLRDLETLVQGLDEFEVDASLKRELVAATKSFVQLLSHKSSFGKWDESRKRFLSDGHLTAFRWFSQTARRHRPLRAISDNERKELTEKIAEAIEVVLQDEELQSWMRPMLLEGLNRLHFVLTRLPFFGHELAISEIILIKQRADVVAAALEDPSRSSGFWSFVTVVSLAGNLFILPDQGLTALQRYSSWAQRAVAAMLDDTKEHVPSPVHLLAPPSALVPLDNFEAGDGGSSSEE